MSERKPLGWVVLRTMTDPQSVVIHQRMHSERVYASPELAAQYLGADFTTTGGVRTTYTVEPIGSVPSGEREARERVRVLEEALMDCAEDLEAELNARYGGPDDIHEALKRRYERDMEPVRRARTVLRALASRPGTEGA